MTILQLIENSKNQLIIIKKKTLTKYNFNKQYYLAWEKVQAANLAASTAIPLLLLLFNNTKTPFTTPSIFVSCPSVAVCAKKRKPRHDINKMQNLPGVVTFFPLL